MTTLRGLAPALLVALACAGGPQAQAPPSPPATPDGVAHRTPPELGPELRPQLAPGEEEAMREEARREIAHAGDLLDALEAEPPAPEDAERIAMTRELLAQARQALEAGDPLGASGLARKAAILAEDLTAR